MASEQSQVSGIGQSGLYHLESLEPRLLLTTLADGDTFRFTDAEGRLVQVTVDGDALIELIGANTNSQTVTLADLPGLFTESELGRAGLEYLLDGSIPINNLDDGDGIQDPLFGPGDAGSGGNDGDEINVQGLASESPVLGGQTYGFNVATVNDNLVVQLVQIDNADADETVEAMLQQGTLGLDPADGRDLSAALGSTPTAMAFDSTTGLLFAVTETGGVSHLWSIERQTGQVTDIGDINNGGSNLSRIQAISFDDAGQMYALTDDYDGDDQADDTGDGTNLDGALIEVDKTNGDVNAGTIEVLSLNGEQLNEAYIALAPDPDSDNWLAVVRRADDGGGNVSSALHLIDQNGVITEVGAITVNGGATVIDGITVVSDANGNDIVVGLDNGQVDEDTGVVSPRLVRINLANGEAAPLSQTGDASTVVGLYRDLASAPTSTGEHLLYAATGTDLFLGSAVTLPVDTAGASTVIDIEAADFRPATGSAQDGLLYFVVEATVDGNVVRDVYTLDVHAGSYSAIQSSLTRVGRIAGLAGENANVTSIAWDQTAADDARLLISVLTLVDGDAQNQILAWDGAAIDNGNIDTAVLAAVTLNGNPVDNITGITIVNDDVTGEDGVIHAILNGGETNDNMLIRINLADGVATELGTTSDGAGDAPITGEDLEGLTWNPTVINPFTGELGALLATDVSTDELVVLDLRFRSANQLFTIYVSHATAGATITVNEIIFSGNDVVQLPYGGGGIAAGDLRITPANTMQQIITFDDTVGHVYIGARQWVTRGDDPPFELLQPVVSASLGTQLGMYAFGRDTAPDGVDLFGNPVPDPNNVGAGIVIDSTMLDFLSGETDLADRTMGSNLDQIDALTIRLDSTAVDGVVVIDNDGRDPAGAAIGANGVPIGAELGLINPVTGVADSVVTITDAATGNPVRRISAAAWANLLFDGNEVLYAINEANDPAPVDRTAEGLGGAIGDVDVDAMTATDTGIVYAVIDNAGVKELLAVAPVVGGGVTTQNLGRVVVDDGAGGFMDIVNIDALDVNPATGEMFIIGDNAVGDVAIFELSLFAVDADLDGTANELIATESAVLLPLGVGDPFLDMNFDAAGVLYAIQDPGAGTNLVTVDTGTGAIAAVGPGAGEIQVAAADLEVSEIGFDDTGLLFGVDRTGGAGNARVVAIDLADPANSAFFSDPGTIADGTVGYAADGQGLFYSISTNPSPADDVLFVSPGMVPVLGTINTGTGVFTTVASLDATLQGVGVRSMTFAPFESPNAPGQQALYIVGGDGRLYEVDANALGAPGQVLGGGGDAIVDADANAVDVDSIAFNQFGTLLLGHDTTNGRLVDIDLAGLGSGSVEAASVVATANGSVRPTVGGLAHDFANDRFLAADNAMGQLEMGGGNEGSLVEAASLMILRDVTGAGDPAEINNVDTHQDFGNVLVGGILTGRVEALGSVNTIYAGAFITGASAGQLEGIPERPDNVSIAGDLRQLIAGHSFGTHTSVSNSAPVYFSGFDLQVGGQVGQVWALDGFVGSFDIGNSTGAPSIATAFQELEGRALTPGWSAGFFYDGTDRFYNDSFDTAQRIGTVSSTTGDLATAQIQGTLYGTLVSLDPIDYYAISLMAGETIELQLDPQGGLALPMGLALIDPDGRIVATNYNAVNSGVTFFEPFQYTTDRPGEHRIALASLADPQFGGQVTLGGLVNYIVNIGNIGDIALGGLHAVNNVLTVSDEPAFVVRNTDLGAIASEAGSLWFDNLPLRHINVLNGNLRAMYAGVDLGTNILAPTIEVRGGGIGSLKNDGSTISVVTGDVLFDISYVDGDIQYVDSASLLLSSVLFTNAGIGVIRSADILGGFFRANTDETGNDGIIDLIDTSGDYGSLIAGGTPIVTGAGGNVRYMRVGGTFWQDPQFLVGDYTPVELDPGQQFVHVDDGGGETIINPQTIENPDFDPTQPVDPIFNPQFLHGSLTVSQYNIRGSGGSVLVDVSTDQFGINFTAKDNSPAGHAVQVSRITLNGSGHAVVTDPETGALSLDDDPDIVGVNVTIGGDLPVEVLDIVGTQVDTIRNHTLGEIVSMDVTSVGEIYTKGRLGVPDSHIGALVNPVTVIRDVYPFSLQSTGIQVSGDVVEIVSQRGLGNLIIGGAVGRIAANSNGISDTDEIEGVLAPIYVAGDLRHINVGEGVAPSGSGLPSRAGIYAEGRIFSVINQSGGDIYGDVVAINGVESLILTNGSLINTQVANFVDLEMASALALSTALFDIDGIVEIETIVLNGRGGIIGSHVLGGEIGNVTVNGGFGIFNSSFENVAGTPLALGNVTADGYGVLGSSFETNSSMGDLTATGSGDVLPTTNFAESVRFWELGLDYDPVYNERLTSLTDFTRAFADSAEFMDVAGQINSVVANGVVNLGDVSAHRIDFTELSFGNKISSIVTGDTDDPIFPFTINDLVVTTGALQRFRPGDHVNALDMTIAGEIRSIRIVGDLLGGSMIRAVGPNGNIGRVRIEGDLVGSLFADGFINRVDIDGDMFGDITVEGNGVDNARALDRLRVDGAYNGSLNVLNGDVGRIDVANTFGDEMLSGDELFIAGNLGQLRVGDRNNADTRFLAADVTVLGDLDRLDIVGQIGAPGDTDGSIFVGGDLRMLNVQAHDNNVGASLINGDITVGGELHRADVRDGDLGSPLQADRGSATDGAPLNVGGLTVTVTGPGTVTVFDDNLADGLVDAVVLSGTTSATVVDIVGGGAFDILRLLTREGSDVDAVNFDGQVFGDGFAITASNEIGRFDVNNGDIEQDFTIESLFNGIKEVEVRNGSLLGTVKAENGEIDRIDVIRGSDLGPVANIIAASANRIRFDGTIFSGATINIAGATDTLEVGESIENTAALSFGSLERLDVTQDMGALLELGFNIRGTRIDIGGNWTVAVGTSIDTVAKVEVGGDLLSGGAGASLHFGRLLDELTVAGQATVDIIADAAVNKIDLGSLTNAVVAIAQYVDDFAVTNAIQNALIQVGISAGDDGVFASAAGEEDANETSRIADVDDFSAGSMTSSILAVGGTIYDFVSGTMTDSSASSGLVLGSHAIRAVIDDAMPLNDAVEQNAARSGTDRTLYHGHIEDARVAGLGLVGSGPGLGSYLTAGVDAGAAGDFSTPSVLTSMTGGTSRFGRIDAINGANSRIVSDAPIGNNNITPGGGTVDTAVTYTIDNLTVDQGNALEGLAGTATDGTPFIAGGLTITVRGNGQVDVRDDNLGDGVIDALVLTGTDDNTRIEIVGGGGFDIARLLTADDATAREIVFDGDFVGDMTDAVDIWIDGPMRTLQFDQLGGAVQGQIGGDVDNLDIGDQGAGRLRIGGEVRKLDIAMGTGTPLQTLLGTYAGSIFNTMSYDALNNLWAHVGGGELNRVDPTLDGPAGVLEVVNLLDAYTGNAPELLGMDFLGATLYGVARLYDPQPTQDLGSINPGGGAVDLRGLAIDNAGDVFAVDTIGGVDQLVSIDATTGERTIIGQLRNPIGNSNFAQDILAMAVDNNDRLIALVLDRDGEGALDGDEGPAAQNEVALVEIDKTAVAGFVQVHQIGNAGAKGVLLDDGGTIQDGFTGLTVDPATGTIYAVRDAAGTDVLVTIDPATGVVTTIGNMEEGGVGTVTEGIGFDADGNLLAFDTSGPAGRLIYLAPADLGSPDQFAELTVGNTPLDANVDVFAVGRTGANFRTYAYDSDTAEGTFFVNGVDPDDPQGRVSVLGTIDLVGNAFQRLGTVSDASGAPALIPQDQASMPLAADAVNGDILIVAPATDGGHELINYDVATAVFTVTGPTVDSLGRDVNVSAMDFDAVTGELIGLELANQRFVTINTTTALTAVRSENGVVSNGLTDLTYDPGAAAFFSYQDGTVDQFVQFKGTTADDAGGLFITSVDRLWIGTPYNGRIVTSGNTFRQVTLEGDFNGTLVTAGDANRITQRNGDFGGVIEARGGIRSARLSGNVTDDARLASSSDIDALVVDGDFGGTMTSMVADRIRLRGDVLDTASFIVTKQVGRLNMDGMFIGDASFGSVDNRLQIDGLIADGATIVVDNNTNQLRFRGGTHANTNLRFEGHVNRLDVDAMHEGSIVVHLDLDRARFEMVNDASLYVGGDGGRLDVRDGATDSLFSYGVMLGADGLYNTADDMIAGGYLQRGRFSDHFTDSMVAVGVLPAGSAGAGVPADHRAMIRDAGTAGTLVANAAEAGSLARSMIGRLDFDLVVHTNSADETTQPIVVTANGIERLRVRSGEQFLNVQDQSDPHGAPTVVNVSQPNADQVRIIFSEPINTDSLRLSETLGDDGTVIVTQNGAIVSGLTLTYGEQTTSTGAVQGVLTITSDHDFDPDFDVNIVLVGDPDHAGGPIMDRSGDRTSLREVNDPSGTYLDGDGNGVEGGNFNVILSAADVADAFDAGPPDVNVNVGSSMTVGGSFHDANDVDVLSFDANANEYFAVDYTGDSDALLGVFYRDDQGTGGDGTDDTFELLARWENSAGFQADPDLFMAFELPVTTEYYVVVAPDPFGDFTVDDSYTLQFTLSATDTALATAVGGVLNADSQINRGGGNVQAIAYVSNAKRTSKQLVYLDFDGGLSTGTDEGFVDVAAFDAAVLDSALAGETDRLLNGGSGVTGILDNILSIMDVGSYLPDLPGVGGLTVDLLDFDAGGLATFNAAATGVYFTTDDPALSGLNPDEDFTTIFIGETNAFAPGLLGLAGSIDVAGLDFADEAIVFTENFEGSSTAPDVTDRLNEYSRYLGNVIVHELLHTMGLNHQPTNFLDYELVQDDPDNDGVVDVGETNEGEFGIMAYAPADIQLSQLGQLGTAPLTNVEFPIGDIDTATMIVWWFA